MPRKVKLILNPMADMGNAWTVANDLRPIVSEYAGQVDWSGTVYPTHAAELARQAAQEGYDLVVALGGDGTAHEVVNGLMQVPPEQRPTLGVVPIGSGNDFAHAIGIPKSPAQALAQTLRGEASKIDIGVMIDERGHREYFDNTLGIGFDAVVTIRSHKLPLLRGFIMYLTAVLQTIVLNHQPARLQIEADHESWNQSTLMLVLCNGPREGGGFMVAPGAKIDDGILHYAMIEACSRLTMLRIVPEVMRGTHDRFKQVRLGNCRELSLKSDIPLYIHADGEILTSFGSNLRGLKVEILPAALSVVRG
jgi:YegS/Rv2252/BmrU family lipid kinase